MESYRSATQLYNMGKGKGGGSYVTRGRSHTGKMQGGSKNTFGKSVTTL